MDGSAPLNVTVRFCPGSIVEGETESLSEFAGVAAVTFKLLLTAKRVYVLLAIRRNSYWPDARLAGKVIWQEPEDLPVLAGEEVQELS